MRDLRENKYAVSACLFLVGERFYFPLRDVHFHAVQSFSGVCRHFAFNYFSFICETSKGVVVSCVLNTDIGFFDSVVFLSKNSAVLRFFLFLRDVLMAAFLAVEICFLSFKLLSLRIFMCMW